MKLLKQKLCINKEEFENRKPHNFTKKLKKIIEKCGATDYTVRRVNELIREKEILATPNPKMSARTLSDQTVELVKEWYRSDEISFVMPGMKDYR